MHRLRTAGPALLVTLHAAAIHWGCSKSEESSGGGGATPTNTTTTTQTDTATTTGENTDAATETSGPLALAGTIALGAEDSQGTGAGLRIVELVADDQTVIGSAETDPTGSFTINIPDGGAALTDNIASLGPRIATLRTLFLNGEESPSAVGLRKQLVIDARDARSPPSVASLTQDEAPAVIDTGTHLAKRVGAIVGQITLESGEDPTGIDIFIPGTTHIAKTDSAGAFILGFLPGGTYTVRADRRGYAPQEWSDIAVVANETTHIEPSVMPIATGPQILLFSQNGGSAIALTSQVTLRIGLKAATKFRVSLFDDFRDMVFRPFDARGQEALVPLYLGGKDGVYTIYLEAADSDGLSAQVSVELLLDTAPPTVPHYTLRTSSAEIGYAANRNPVLFVDSCEDVEKLFIRETATEENPPTADDFALACSDALEGSGAGITVPLSNGDATKELVLWTLDRANQVSPIPRHGMVVLDQTAPTLSVLPACGAYATAIRVAPTTDADATTHYRTDLQNPTASDPTIERELALFSETTFTLRAFDHAGNGSNAVTCTYEIDRDGPILGSIAIDDDDLLLASLSVPLDLSAIGADWMAFAETPAGLIDATFVAYGINATYTLTDSTADGSHTIYVKYKDNAGNVIGENGELSAAVTVDRTAPSDGAITLLTPASPASDFDKLLAWSSSLTNMLYEVEVYEYVDGDDAFAHRVRPDGSSGAMETAETSITVSPALTDAGTYYWRVRAIDAAGNASGWVEATEDKAFVLTELATAFSARRRYQGIVDSIYGASCGMGTNQDKFFGRDLIEVGDLNASGASTPEIAYSILATPSTVSGTMGACGGGGGWGGDFQPGVCDGCGAVVVRDVENDSELFRLQEDGSSRTLYGQRILACDVIPGGTKEIVVTAPGYPFVSERDGMPGMSTIWLNAGAVFVYGLDDDGNMVRIAKYVEDASSTNAYDTWCTGSAVCGSNSMETDPAALDRLPPSWRIGSLFGWSVACEASGDSNGDRIWVGEPGWMDSNVGWNMGGKGRMVRLRYAAGELTNDGAPIEGTTDGWAFGSSSVFMTDFKFNGSCTGPGLAVGVPRYTPVGTTTQTGAVFLYKRTGANSWAACDTIESPTTMTGWGTPAFGLSLFDLGDLNSSGLGNKLAVGEPGPGDNGWQQCGTSNGPGPVRIYGDNDSAAIAAARVTATDPCMGSGQSYGRFGHQVSVVGDLVADDISGPDAAPEIGVGVPYYEVNRRSQAGAILLWKWADLIDMKDESDTPVTPRRTVVGIPEQANYFGARFFVRPDSTDGYMAEPAYMVASRPGWGMTGGMAGPAMPAMPGMGGGEAGVRDRGRVEEYATNRLKFGQPTRIIGGAAEAGFGAAILSVPDADGDGVKDLLVAQPKGRCDGVDFGSLSLLAGSDAREMRRLCGPHYDSRFGSMLLASPTAGRVFIGYQSRDATPQLMLLARSSGTPAAQARETLLETITYLNPMGIGMGDTTHIAYGATGAKYSTMSLSLPTPAGDGMMPPVDVVYVGDSSLTDGMNHKGGIYRVKLINNSDMANGHLTVEQMMPLLIRGSTTSTDFGMSVSASKYIDGSVMIPAERPYFLAGAPGEEAVYGANGDCNAADITMCGTWWKVIVDDSCSIAGSATAVDCLKLSVNNAPMVVNDSSGAFAADGAVPSTAPEAEFGTTVVALPDLDAPDSNDDDGDATEEGVDTYEVFFLVSNVSMRDSGSRSRTPQVFLIGINLMQAHHPAAATLHLPSIKILYQATGDSGSMLGANMVAVEDLDADSKPDLAIAESLGQGLFGATGQIQILSSGKIMQQSASVSPLVQVIFNPDNQQSNFGVSITQADMNGDGYQDVLVGADQYSTSTLTNAGAVYVFPMEPVKN